MPRANCRGPPVKHHTGKAHRGKKHHEAHCLEQHCDEPTSPAIKFKHSKTKSVSAADVLQERAKKNTPWTKKTAFQSIIGVAITCNAVSMGMEVDFAEDNGYCFLILEHVFTAVFVIELAFRWRIEGVGPYFREPASILDFILVVLAVVDVWIMQQLGIDGDIRFLTLLRLVRLARLARLLRIFRIFKELTVILSGLIGSLKTLFWVAIFLLVLVYIFAIIATTNFGKASTCEDSRRLAKAASSAGAKSDASSNHAGDASEGSADDCDMYIYPAGESQLTLFGSMDHSILTLYLCLTEGCGDTIIKPMALTNPATAMFWLTFVFLTSFGLLNVIIGLICENMMAASAGAEAEMRRQSEEVQQEHLQHLMSLFHAMDADGSGSIEREEFLAAMVENEDVMKTLQALELHEEANLFDNLDVEGTGAISAMDFFEGLLLVVRGNEACKAKDLVPTFLACRSIQRKVSTLMDHITDVQTHKDRITDVQSNTHSEPQQPWVGRWAYAPASTQSDLDLASARDQANRVQTIETQVGSITDTLRVMTDEIKALRQQVHRNHCEVLRHVIGYSDASTKCSDHPEFQTFVAM